jgi:hypothetical protein
LVFVTFGHGAGLERDDEDDVTALHREELVRLGRRAAVQRLHGGVRERQEVALRGIQQVGDPAAIAVAGEVDGPANAVAGGFEEDALATMFHAALIGRVLARVEGCGVRETGR